MKIQMDALVPPAVSGTYATDVSITPEQEIRTARPPNVHTGSTRTDLNKNLCGTPNLTFSSLVN